VQQEADARSKLASFAASAADIEAEMARFKSEFEMYSQHTSYLTQLTTEAADGGEEEDEPHEPDSGWELRQRQSPADIEEEVPGEAASYAYYAQPSPAAKEAREDLVEDALAAAEAGEEAESVADDAHANFVSVSRGAEVLRAPVSRAADDLLDDSLYTSSLWPDSLRRDSLPASDVLEEPPGSAHAAHSERPDPEGLAECGVPADGGEEERGDFESEADDDVSDEEFTAVDIMAAPSPIGRRVA
jgi:hypothetical protein